MFYAQTCFADPFEISIEFSLYLLLTFELEELAPVLHTLSFFGELAGGKPEKIKRDRKIPI